MTCRQLGGACDQSFQAESFEEIAQLSQIHGQKMMQENDKAHLEAMEKMKQLMKKPGAMEQWMDEKRRQYESLPES